MTATTHAPAQHRPRRKKMAMKKPGVCVDCGAKQPLGQVAYYFIGSRVVRCVPCVEGPAPVDELARGGSSARRLHQRRSERDRAEAQAVLAADDEWRARVKHHSPIFGRIASFLTPRPTVQLESQTARAWAAGADGEELVARLLAETPSIDVLNDRVFPGKRRANIDHIVVAPTGVIVVDTKNYTGLVECRAASGKHPGSHRLFVNGRNQTKLVTSVQTQAAAIEQLLDNTFPDVPVHPVLCFVRSEWQPTPLINPYVDDTTITSPDRLQALVTEQGPFADQIADVAQQLRRALPAN